MRCQFRAVCCLLFLVVLLGPNVRNAQAEVTAEQVRRTIDKAIAYLRRTENGRGHWHESSYYPGGISALCTLALLEAGVPTDDPLIRRSLNYLRAIKTEKVYVRALQLMVFCRAGGQAQDRPLIREIVRWLESTQLATGPARGGWGYPQGRGGGDPSNSQFAVLALHEAEQAGFEVLPRTWTGALGYWSRLQNDSGAWQYPNKFGSGSMTCAGIASMVIALGNQGEGGAAVENGDCRCGDGGSDERIEKGLAWLGKHFSITRNPGDDRWHYYYLYGLERVGRMTARRFFYGVNRADGSTQRYDWYREGADYLVKRQQPDGFWEGAVDIPDRPEIATSFALLFLSKGRRPVLISKLRRTEDDWNRLRYDLTNLTRYTERQWKTPMTWQVIDGQHATADDYSQTPVLFVSGRDAFEWTPVERQELRRYIEQGGFIFADQCCSGSEFDRSFRREMGEIFPEKGFELKPLDPQHPIWTIDERIDGTFVDPDARWLWGIDFACKTSVVYCPANLSCYWALDTVRDEDTYPPDVQAEIAACRAIGVNVLAYATNRKLKPKDAIPRSLAATKAQGGGVRGHFAIAKLRHAGGCDAAPRAMANLMDAVAHALDIRTAANPPLIALTDEAIFDHSFVYVHGRHDFRLSAQERRSLKTFVERGGTVMADAICASEPFARAFRREMRETFGQPLERIPLSDPIYTAEYGGSDLDQVTRRESFRARAGGPVEIKERRGPAELEGIKIDDRHGIIFSPLDLSCALERHVAAHCRGYTPEDAALIAINVILYSLHE